MIYVTGDTHGLIHADKLYRFDFTYGDTVIIAGDFGGVWYNNFRDNVTLDWYERLGVNVLFVDGNHENHEALDNLPVVDWNGGKVHKVRENIIHLMRGQVYTIEGNKIFTFGGADSIDKLNRTVGISWWEREMPSYDEYVKGLINLDKNNWDVDYVITHSCPVQVMSKLLDEFYTTQLERYLGDIDKELKFKKWYFGHFHVDKDLGKHRALFQDVLELGGQLPND